MIIKIGLANGLHTLSSLMQSVSQEQRSDECFYWTYDAFGKGSRAAWKGT